MSIRAVVRLALVFFGGFFVGGRVVDAVRAWRLWQETAASDPSAADLYRTTFWIDVGSAGVTAALVGLIYYLLRPRRPAAVNGGARREGQP
jgi:ABC-type Fe3+ transport system permease subunit